MIKNTSSKPESIQFLCIELLKKFSMKELTALACFVESKYFNTDELLVKLLAALKQWVLCEEHFNNALLAEVYKMVFDEKVIKGELNAQQKKLFNYKLSALLRLTERFLVIESIDEYPAYYDDILYEKILGKRQFKLFKRHIKRSKKQLEVSTKKNMKDYEHLQKIEENILDYQYLSNQLQTQDNLPTLIYFTDIAYLSKKLGQYSTILFLEDVTSKKYDISAIEAIKELLDIPEYTSHPLIQIYQVANRLTKTQNELVYKELLVLLENHSVSITKADLKGFYTIAANFCARQIQKGQFGFQQLFEVYKTMDEKNLLFDTNFISVDELKTIVAASCRIGKFDWALQMIEKYQPYVEKKTRQSVYHFNLGVVAFYQQDYPKALHHFIRVESVNFNYDINCRVIMLKSHYECDKEYDERTLQIFRSAEKYFNENQQLTTKNKKAYKNFIRTFINVYRIRFGATKMKLEDLTKKLEKQDVNSDKKWLLEKIEQIKFIN